MLLNNKLCADAGTVNCPCYLAEHGKCIVCTRLSGADGISRTGKNIEVRSGDVDRTPVSCDCQWQGVCIYNEYLQNNRCIKERMMDGISNMQAEVPGERRQIRLCKIQKIKWFDDDLAVMRLGVPRGMAEKAALPGSFVFVKSPGAEVCFDFPVSVLQADYGNSVLEIAVKAVGPKSRALLQQYRNTESPIDDVCRKPLETEASGWVELRGIYRNGLLGAEKLMKAGVHRSGIQGLSGDTVSKRVLCLTKGVGIAPVANYIRWSEGRDHIDVIADLDKINREFADYVLQGTDINSLKYSPLSLNMSWAESEKYDVIIISASDYYQQNIYIPEAKKVLSNNHTMCCGEGICGSCICADSGGREHRNCKDCRVK